MQGVKDTGKGPAEINALPGFQMAGWRHLWQETVPFPQGCNGTEDAEKKGRESWAWTSFLTQEEQAFTRLFRSLPRKLPLAGFSPLPFPLPGV